MGNRMKKSWSRTIAAVAAGAVLAIGGVVAVAAPANAAPSGCQTQGKSCLWSGYDYGTDAAQNWRMLYFEYCIDNLGNYSYNDITSSAYNYGFSDNARFYEHDLQNGYYFTILRHDGKPNLNNVDGQNWNDRITSAYFTGALGSKGTSRCA